MSDLEKEFQEYDACGYWLAYYQRVKNEASIHAMNEDYETTQARKAENRTKNRYRDVSPYDHSRIILEKGKSDYINASLIKVPEADRQYILAQGPLEHTVGQFWQMVWEQKSRAVLMLNRVMEKGTVKCFQYWPLGSSNDGPDVIVCSDVQLQVTLLDEEELGHYIVRTLELEDIETGETREVLHFHYITWPDFGVPSSPLTFLNFLMSVRQSGVLDSDGGPPVIHCSAGIGRSGTLCLVDSCLIMIEKNQDLDSIDLKTVLINMRSYRMGLIQTPDQLRFSYLAIIEGGKRILSKQETTSSIDSGFSEEGPPPPPRSSSLSPARSSPPKEPPPKPPRLERSGPVEANENDITDRLIDSQTSENHDSGYEVRRRVREERQKNTRTMIEKMKAKQRQSEHWKKRKSYLKPICLGITLIIGSILLYKFYYR